MYIESEYQALKKEIALLKKALDEERGKCP